jgi:hypothetical protein
MANHEKLIPTSESALKDRVCKVVDTCKRHREAWDIEALALENLEGLYDDFVAGYERCQRLDTRTPVEVIRKNAAKKSLISSYREFYQLYLKPKRKLIGDCDWAAMELPPVAAVRRRKMPAPTGVTDLTIAQSGRHGLHITFRDRFTGKLRPQAGIKFVMLRHAVLDNAPASESELGSIQLETGKSFTREFDTRHKGKMAYFSACYVNTQGEMGPWSAPVGAMIP